MGVKTMLYPLLNSTVTEYVAAAVLAKTHRRLHP
jgi:hypothetical protein